MRRVTRRGKTIVSKASRATSTISATPKMTASSLRIIMLPTLDCRMPLTQDMHIAVALQELAEGCTGYAVLIRTVYDNLVLFVERLQRLTGGGEMEGTRDMLGQVGPTHS